MPGRFTFVVAIALASGCTATPVPAPATTSNAAAAAAPALAPAPAEQAIAGKLEVHVYSVPPEQTDTLAKTLNQVLVTSDTGGVGIGKVSTPSPGQLLVLAPAPLQASIESSLKTMTEHFAAPAAGKPMQQYRLSFWSVDAIPGGGRDDPDLVSLTPALTETRSQLGAPLHFELRDHITAVSSPNEAVTRKWLGQQLSAQTAAPLQSIEYRVFEQNGGLMLEFRVAEQVPVALTRGDQTTLQYAPTGSETTTSIKPGETLVVTQNPVPKNAVNIGEIAVSQRVMRLYLVRVDEAPAT